MAERKHRRPPAGKPAPEMPVPATLDERLDEALEETFPASDPIAISPAPGEQEEAAPAPERPRQRRGR